MSPIIVPKLFQPTKVGKVNLAHRVVLAPMTRCRANAAHVHGDLAVEYYSQRGSVPGTLLITEGTIVAAKAGGYPFIPGIWSDEQVVAWKRVTDAVHEKGSRIFCQLWAVGRAAMLPILKSEDPSFELESASAIPVNESSPTPRALTIAEIKEYIQLFTTGAVNAIRAGFDGVELHAAGGYLLDTFLQDVSNKRTDEYGGSIENRSRLVLDIIESISKEIGSDRIAIKLGPWITLQGMRMADPKPTFSYLVSQIAKLYPDFAYIHVVEPRVDGPTDREVQPDESNEFLREIWLPRPYLSIGGYDRELALEQCEKTGELIGFARSFITNPDLPLRLARNLPAPKGGRETYPPPFDARNYTDHPFYAE